MEGCRLSLDRLSVEELAELGSAVDGVLFEVLKVSTVPATLAIERKLAALLGSGWKRVASGVLQATVAPFASKPVTPASIKRFLGHIGGKLASPLSKAQIATLERHVKDIWTIAKKVRANELKIPLRFDMIDRRAVAAINRQQVFWTNGFYNRHMSDRIRAVTEDVMLKRGFSRAEAGRQLNTALKQEMGLLSVKERSRFAASVPARFAGDPDRYFGDVASNAAHQARTFGSIVSFQEAGVVTFQLDNPMDERTGKICQHMHGQTFTVEQGAKQMDGILAATDPADVKDTAPWLSAKELGSVIGSEGRGSQGASDALVRAGVTLPPFHPRCRTEIVVMDVGGGGLDAARVQPSSSDPRVVTPAGAKVPPAAPAPGGVSSAPIGNPLPLGLPKGPGGAPLSTFDLSQLGDAELRASCIGDLRAMPLSSLAEVKASEKAIKEGVKAAEEIIRALEKTAQSKRAREAKKWLRAAKNDRASIKKVKSKTFPKKGVRMVGHPEEISEYEAALHEHYPEAAINHINNSKYKFKIVKIEDAFSDQTHIGRGARAPYHGLHKSPRQKRWGQSAAPGEIHLREDLRSANHWRYNEVAIHEHAHFIDAATEGRLGSILESAAKPGKEFVSDYGKENAQEFLAEMHGKIYVRGSLNVGSTAPQSTAIVDAMVSSDEAYRRTLMIVERSKKAGIGPGTEQARQLGRDIVTAGKKAKPVSAPVPVATRPLAVIKPPVEVKPLPKPRVKPTTRPPKIKPPIKQPPPGSDLTRINFEKMSVHDIRSMAAAGKVPKDVSLRSLPREQLLKLRAHFQHSSDIYTEAIFQKRNIGASTDFLGGLHQKVQAGLRRIAVIAGEGG